MGEMTVDNRDRDDTIVLRRDEETGGWLGLALEPWRAHDAAAGPAGPAGIVTLRSGRVAVNQCILSGRVERISLPSRCAPGEQALLGLFTEDTLPDGDETVAELRVHRLVIEPLAERSALTRWARLDEAVDRVDEDHISWPYLLVEYAVRAAQLHGLAPGWMDATRVDHTMAGAAEVLQVHGGLPDPRTGRGTAAGDGRLDRLRRWCVEMLDLLAAVEDPEGPERRGDGRLDARARSFIRQSLEERRASLAPDRLPNYRGAVPGMLGAEPDGHLDGPRPVRGAEPEGFLGVAVADGAPYESRGREHKPRSTLHLVGDRSDLRPAEEPGIPVEGGQVTIDEHTARRLDLTPGTGSVTAAPGTRWIEIQLPASSGSSPTSSRWAVLQSDGAPDGVATLVLRTEGAQPVVRGWAVATGPDRLFLLAEHPFRPDRADDAPSVLDIVEVARRAMDHHLVGSVERASSGWLQVALGWLRLGSLVRAAWALEASGSELPDVAFADPAAREAAQHVLDAIVESGAVPPVASGPGPTEDVGWVLVAEPVEDAEGGSR